MRPRICRKGLGVKWLSRDRGRPAEAQAPRRPGGRADVAVSVTNDGEAEALIRELQALGYRVAALVEQEATRRLATIRLIPRGERERLIASRPW